MTLQQHQKQKTTNKALYSLFTMVVVVAGLSFAPAFAASSVSTGPWNIQQEIPSYDAAACTGSSKACANARSTGVNSLISRGDNFAYENAIARNNMQKSPNLQGSLPQLTTTSPIKYKANFVYSGSHTIATGHLGYYQYGADLMEQSGSNWVKSAGCYQQVTGNGLKSGSPQNVCSFSFTGTKTFQIGTQHDTLAYPYLFGSTDVIDYWTGSYHADTTRLELCTGC